MQMRAADDGGKVERGGGNTVGGEYGMVDVIGRGHDRKMGRATVGFEYSNGGVEVR